MFLENVVTWLYCWRAIPSTRGKFTPQTFTSFRHTCLALPLLIKRLTLECGYEYLLTPRIQNDALEHYFGLYRQMSLSHYNISYCQILESECKLQLSNLLKFLYNEQAGSDTLCIKDYLRSFADDNVEERHSEIDLEYFLQMSCLTLLTLYLITLKLNALTILPVMQCFLILNNPLNVVCHDF